MPIAYELVPIHTRNWAPVTITDRLYYIYKAIIEHGVYYKP